MNDKIRLKIVMMSISFLFVITAVIVFVVAKSYSDIKLEDHNKLIKSFNIEKIKCKETVLDNTFKYDDFTFSNGLIEFNSLNCKVVK